MLVSKDVLSLKQTDQPLNMVEDPDWKALRYGDTCALEVLFRKYYQVMMNYGLKLIRDKSEVDDCIQTIFLNLWERKENLGPSTSAKFYLLASLRRMLLKQATTNQMLTTLDNNITHPGIVFSPESDMIKSQTEAVIIHLLHKAIEDLPIRQKEALFLKYYEEHSFQEIGIMMNISTRAVYKLLYKAIENLNQTLQPKASSFTTLLHFVFL